MADGSSLQPKTRIGSIETRKRASPHVYTKDPYTDVFALDIPREKHNNQNSPIYLLVGGVGSETYQTGYASSGKIENHCIIFKDYTFTVDGGSPRYINDPNNRTFLKSIIEKKLPGEFGSQGYHVITAMKFYEDVINEEDLFLSDSDCSDETSDSDDE